LSSAENAGFLAELTYFYLGRDCFSLPWLTLVYGRNLAIE
jgi:hypothetical protein